MTSPTYPEEQRSFSRIPFDALVRVMAQRGAYQGELLDLSLKGALVRLSADHELTSGQAVRLEIPLNDDTRIDMQATVAHVEQGRVGFRCDHIDVESITHLARIVELNTGDPELLHRELSALGQNRPQE